MKPAGTESSNPGSERKISVRELLRDFRAGASAQDLMKKYRTSWESLQRVFEKLVQSGLISEADLDRRSLRRTDEGDKKDPGEHKDTEREASLNTHRTVFECPACGMPQDQVFKECPQCGIIVDKYLNQQERKKKAAERKIKSSRRRKWVAAGLLVAVTSLAIVWLWVSPVGKLPTLPDMTIYSVFNWKSVKNTIQKAVTGSGTSQPAQGDLYALVVGIVKYENSSIPTLNTSDVDAEDFAKFLRGQTQLFKRINVKLLVNKEATLRNVKTYVHNDLLLAGKDDSVVLFFSGHGAADARWPGQFFFMTHDTDPDALKSTAFEMTGLQFLDRLDAKRILVIADACHSGSASRYHSPATAAIALKSIAEPLQHLMRQFQESRGKAIMTSCRYDEYSAEMPLRFRNSVFTHFLLEGLKGAADKDEDRVVSLSEAYDYVYHRAKDETGGIQHPKLEGSVEGTFPLALVKSEASAPIPLSPPELEKPSQVEQVVPPSDEQVPAMRPTEEPKQKEEAGPQPVKEGIVSCNAILETARELRKTGKPWLSDLHLKVGDYSASCEKESKFHKDWHIKVFCYRCLSPEGRTTYQQFVGSAYYVNHPIRDPIIEWGGSLGCPCE